MFGVSQACIKAWDYGQQTFWWAGSKTMLLIEKHNAAYIEVSGSVN